MLIGSQAAVLCYEEVVDSCHYFFSSKSNRGQWLPDSVILRKEGGNEMLTFLSDFAFGKHPKATVCWLIISAGVSSGWFWTKCLCLGCAMSCCTSLGYGKYQLWMLFIHVFGYGKNSCLFMMVFFSFVSLLLVGWGREDLFPQNDIWSDVF